MRFVLRRLAKAGLEAMLAMTAMWVGPVRVQAGSVSVWHPLGFSRVGEHGERPTVLESAHYALRNNLTQARFDNLTIKDANGMPGANLFAAGPFGGMSLAITDAAGKVYSSIYHNGTVLQGQHGGTPFYDTSMRLHVTGDLYHESEIMGIGFAAADGTVLPAEAQIHMYQWDDRIYFKVVLNARDNLQIQKAEIIAAFADGAFDRIRIDGQDEGAIPAAGELFAATPVNSGLVLGNSGKAGSVAWIISDPAGTQSFQALRGSYGLQTTPTLIVRQALCDSTATHADTAFTAGTKLTNTFQLYFSKDGATAEGYDNLQAELHPLTLKVLGSSSGAGTVGEYNKLNGTYTVNIPTEHANSGGYRFSNTFQNYYETVKLEIPADSIPRRNRICIFQPTGLWGAGVEADAFGYPRGGQVMVSRGMKSFHVVATQANKADVFEHKGAFKRYGESPAYLISHEDLGSGYDPHGQMWLNAVNGINGGFSYSLVQRVYSSICDVSGIDGNPKGGNPSDQFPENTGGHEFLKYRTATPDPSKSAATPTPAPDAAAASESKFHQIEFPVNTDWHLVEFKGLDYDRLSPLLIDGNWRGFSDDHKIETSIHLINVPFTDVCRMFIHARYDVKQPIKFDAAGALKRGFRLFSMGDEHYGQSDYPRFAYTDAAGVIRNQDWAKTVGIPLGGPHPFCAVYPNVTGSRGMLIRNYKARINGVENNKPAVTLNLIEKKRAGYWLVPDSDAAQLQPGDYFDIEFEISFWGTENSDYTPMQAEAEAWGSDGLRLEMTRGKQINDLPVRIEAEHGQAAFTLHGGRNYLPVEIGSFDSNAGPDYKLPLLEECVNGVWIPFNPEISGKDGWDVHRDETTGKSSFIYNIWTDGSVRKFRFSLSANRLDFEDALAAGSGAAKAVPAEHGGAYVAPTATGATFDFTYALDAPGNRMLTPVLFARSTAEAVVRLAVNGVDRPDFTMAAGEAFGAQELPAVELKPGKNALKFSVISGAPDLDYLQFNYEQPAATQALDTVVIGYRFPPIVNYGENLTATIRMKNTGTATWAGPNFTLQALDLFDGKQDFALAPGENVAPGETHTFSIALAGPHLKTASQYRAFVSQWRMAAQGAPFGPLFKHEIQASDLFSYAKKEFTSPSFEEGAGTPPAAWSLVGAVLTRDTAHTGTYCVRLQEAANNSITQTVGWDQQGKYKFSFWAKTGALPVDSVLRILLYSAQDGKYLAEKNFECKGTSDWTQHELEFDTAGAEQASFSISVTGKGAGTGANAGKPEAGRDIYLDDVALSKAE